MPALRFVHLSDIHFGQEHEGEVIIHDDVRKQLIRDCRDYTARIGSATAILITGDTAYSGEKSEYEKAGEWLDRLADTVGCKRRKVRVIPGNHDVDISKIGRSLDLVHKHLRQCNIDSLNAELSELADEPEETNHLVSKLAAYRKFAERYGCDFDSTQRPMWTWKVPLNEAHTLHFTGLNSVQVSDLDDALENMVLGANQYVITEHDDVEYVVMLHHPLHWLRDRVKAGTYLKRARVLLFGHEHRLEIEKKTDVQGGERLEIDTGATNPPEGGGDFNYRYNWIEIESRTDDGNVYLDVTIHPRVWTTTAGGPRFDADHGTTGVSDSVTMSVACPHFQPYTPSADASSDQAMLDDATEREEVTVKSPDPEDFAQLRYLFWRYLPEWQTRMTVLVELDILPIILDKPVPQTLERQALERARNESGKLAELWERVMAYVPEEEKQDNPFTGD